MLKPLPHSYSTDKITENNQSAIEKQPQLDEYVSERVFKQKSPLCRIAIPYIFEQDQPEQRMNVKDMLAKKKKKQIPQHPQLNLHKPFKPVFNYQKTPINEYLSYELSEQINFGLKEVKILADEIKHIKDQKKKEIMQGQDKKQNKKMRIRRTNFKDKKHLNASAGCLR